MQKSVTAIWNELKSWRGSIAAICFATTGLLLIPSACVNAQNHTRAASNQVNAQLRFEKNHGQTDAQVKFLARAANYSIFLTSEEADVVLHQEAQTSGPSARGKIIVVRANASVLRMRFANSNPPTRMIPFDPSRPNLSSSRASASSSAVAYRGLYPGVDVIFRGDQKKIGFQLNLSPGAETDDIALEFDGTQGITLDAAGDAVVHIGKSSLVIERPVIFENRNGQREQLAGAYRVGPHNRLQFVIVPPSVDDQLSSD
ncbi:MAG TPA: hypothetical protein VGR81_14480 [Candidatus Acidoferrales bacterium]|nr:hypothetical protein [Candidatus Acidoferrales bacterium]